ncbi:helix-turn-helix domain-containing protein [Pseudorhodoferax sp. Leaf267]|uniref:helix-turn-helix domain-containing protein n=1 Tax=Pseudorhodoferax sp. Leaf267 TaxID=1736316 RepID=UPI000700C1DA|nr:helix-turn-helix domain-containing protein [Pseudorhodoferax sp. Leaf267]KQP13626.1 AraC family transcriptional regulator [Pseudorhodoferax sp. Leaf267]
MQPDLELVQIGRAQSFKAWEHGYPFRTVRWHFHPECELHHVVATTGRCFVGDHIGDFAPGHLVLTGPNLPHNWVSHVPAGTTVPLRGRVLQFNEQFIRDAAQVLPELAAFLPLLDMSRRGVLFTPETAAAVGPMVQELIGATDIRRIELFMAIVGTLSRAKGSRALSSDAYHPDPSGFMATGINESLNYIRNHLTESFGEKELAAIARLSPGAFSRSFRRHTGMAFSVYVNRLRVNLASQLLMSDEHLSITDICFASGFKNISNFNRQFLRHKGFAPSRFRTLLAENADLAQAA